jgi:hypothetical protein
VLGLRAEPKAPIDVKIQSSNPQILRDSKTDLGTGVYRSCLDQPPPDIRQPLDQLRVSILPAPSLAHRIDEPTSPGRAATMSRSLRPYVATDNGAKSELNRRDRLEDFEAVISFN